jgi:hypothetical protein
VHEFNIIILTFRQELDVSVDNVMRRQSKEVPTIPMLSASKTAENGRAKMIGDEIKKEHGAQKQGASSCQCMPRKMRSTCLNRDTCAHRLLTDKLRINTSVEQCACMNACLLHKSVKHAACCMHAWTASHHV